MFRCSDSSNMRSDRIESYKPASNYAEGWQSGLMRWF